ncbi:hypothetical protein BJ546DRAFT_946837 [Cryomyces antarcticus]
MLVKDKAAATPLLIVLKAYGGRVDEESDVEEGTGSVMLFDVKATAKRVGFIPTFLLLVCVSRIAKGRTTKAEVLTAVAVSAVAIPADLVLCTGCTEIADAGRVEMLCDATVDLVAFGVKARTKAVELDGSG